MIKKWQLIDLIRTFCVLAVLGVHSYSNVPFDNPWSCWFWSRFCINGIYGVFIFFIISGFLITNVISHNRGGLVQPDLFQFYAQRIGRIWPLYFACLFGGCVVFTFLPPNHPIYSGMFLAKGDYGFWFWLSLPLFLFNWFLIGKNVWDYSAHWMILWSLSIEEQFYLLYPLALLKLRTERSLVVFLWVILWLAVAWRFFFYFHSRNNDFIQTYATNSKLDLIAIGILLFFAVRRYGTYLAQHQKLSMLLCAAGFLLTLVSYFGSQENDRFTEIYISEVIGLGVFLFLLGGLHLPFFESPSLKILALPGKYCYGCYLLHPMVLLILHPFLNPNHVLMNFSLVVLLTTFIAFISYRFFEKPLKHFIRKSFCRIQRQGV
jgi:peptidoglycan/LPS O-acetylase OafA/YrhL